MNPNTESKTAQPIIVSPHTIERAETYCQESGGNPEDVISTLLDHSLSQLEAGDITVESAVALPAPEDGQNTARDIASLQASAAHWKQAREQEQELRKLKRAAAKVVEPLGLALSFLRSAQEDQRECHWLDFAEHATEAASELAAVGHRVSKLSAKCSELALNASIERDRRQRLREAAESARAGRE